MTAMLQVEETNIPRKIRSYGMEPVIDRQSHLSLSLSLPFSFSCQTNVG